MQGEYKVITLCGSTKFKDEFLRVQKELTLKGYIVISVGLFGHSGDNEVWTDDTKTMLDNMHKAKIDMADEIFVINVDGYIGESTRSEIEYAQKNKKPVKYLVTCGSCENYIGGGDWNLCCKESHDPKKFPLGHLCYENTPVCEKFKPIYKLTEEEFLKKYCYRCGTQRCEGMGTVWFDGCKHRYELENYVDNM